MGPSPCTMLVRSLVICIDCMCLTSFQFAVGSWTSENFGSESK